MMTDGNAETAASGRSKCKQTTCNKSVIAKDTLRLGTWLEINARGNWAWKHW